MISNAQPYEAISREPMPGSFRDPSGFVFRRDGVIYRQIQRCYRKHYDTLMRSGLYARLVEQGALIPHEEVLIPLDDAEAYKVIKPLQVPFISYPYEWSFSQLKDAALLTLRIQQLALDHQMVLKDASAYNIQFIQGKPVFIDTLSFATYDAGAPWVAYRQFCQHFLAPLALMSQVDIRLRRLCRTNVDGIPLDLASRLLPWKTRFDLSLCMHIHLHARYQQRYADAYSAHTALPQTKVSGMGLRGLIESLQAAVRKLRWKPGETEWGNYYQETNYSPVAFQHKQALVKDFLQEISPRTVWDLGANAGVFSHIAATYAEQVVAFDMDPVAVEQQYRACAAGAVTGILPLLVDLTNPSPNIGWAQQEREGMLERGPVDAALALALIHHLAIGNNLPFARIAAFFRQCAAWLIIEFVPKTDSQVQLLLASREDIFPRYTQEDFARAFADDFTTARCEPIDDSQRVLYLMKRK
jgi:hypothetical protein